MGIINNAMAPVADPNAPANTPTGAPATTAATPAASTASTPPAWDGGYKWGTDINKDWANNPYWAGTKAGDPALAYANGALTRNADGTATYKATGDTGAGFTFSKDTSIADVAAGSKDIAAEWKKQYGYGNDPASANGPASVAPVSTTGTTQANASNDGTVQGRLGSIMDENSPLMQQAKTQGLQIAADRGVLNSSMAQTAAQDSMYRAATPIATADAGNATQLASANIGANASMHNADVGAAASRYGADVSAATSITTNAATNKTSADNTAANNTTSIANTKSTNETSLATSKLNNETTVSVNKAKDDNALLISKSGSAATSFDKLNATVAAIDADPKMSIEDKTTATQHALALFQLSMDALKSGGVPDVTHLLDGTGSPATPATNTGLPDPTTWKPGDPIEAGG